MDQRWAPCLPTVHSAGEVNLRFCSVTPSPPEFLFPCLRGGTALAGSGERVALPRRACYSTVNKYELDCRRARRPGNQNLPFSEQASNHPHRQRCCYRSATAPAVILKRRALQAQLWGSETEPQVPRERVILEREPSSETGLCWGYFGCQLWFASSDSSQVRL